MSAPAAGNRSVIRAAVVQMDVVLGRARHNLDRVLARLDEAAGGGAECVVFPECALSGYCFDDPAEALTYALPVDDPLLEEFAAACSARRVTGVLGFLERDGDALRNSALVVTDGVSVYRKTHLPTLGVDRFAVPGDSLAPCPAPFGRLGTLICYDVRFPEAPRCLALQGAEVVALPTNWPEGAESSPEFITRARAWENRVYVLAANRVGVERGRRFIGRSQVVAPSGAVLREAGSEEEVTLVADLDLAQARRKRVVIEAGAWELDTTGDRRPALYGPLLAEEA